MPRAASTGDSTDHSRPSPGGTVMILALPGMGADHRLFLALRRRIPDLVALPWLAPRADERLEAYAARYARLVRRWPGCWLLGVSFGGMLAQAIARTAPVAGVVLAGSCRDPTGLLPGARMLASLGAVLPDAWWRLGPALLPPALLRLAGVRDDRLRRQVAAQARAADPVWMRWCCRAIADWAGQAPPVPVRQIHGRADGIMPVERQRPDRVLVGAGHLLAATHAEAVAGFLAREAIATGRAGAGPVRIPPGV